MSNQKVDEDVRWAMFFAVNDAVYWAMGRAVNRVVYGAVADAVYETVYWAASAEPKHPALQVFLHSARRV